MFHYCFITSQPIIFWFKKCLFVYKKSPKKGASLIPNFTQNLVPLSFGALSRKLLWYGQGFPPDDSDASLPRNNSHSQLLESKAAILHLNPRRLQPIVSRQNERHNSIAISSSS